MFAYLKIIPHLPACHMFSLADRVYDLKGFRPRYYKTKRKPIYEQFFQSFSAVLVEI